MPHGSTLYQTSGQLHAATNFFLPSHQLQLKSLKRVKGKERLASKQRRQLDIAELLKRYDDKVHPLGEALPVSTRIYGVNVVTALLKAGVSLSKLDSFRDNLRKHVCSF